MGRSDLVPEIGQAGVGGGDEFHAAIIEHFAAINCDNDVSFAKASLVCGAVPVDVSDEHAARAVEAETGVVPEASTSGGTSDARFIKDVTRVVEFGLVGETMHKVDERVPVEDIRKLSAIYETLLSSYFKV